MRIRTRSIVIVLSRTIRQLVTLCTAVALVRLITKDELGTYRQANFVAGFLVSTLGLGLPICLYYFVPQYDDQKRRLLITQTVEVSMVLAVVIGTIMLLGADPIALQLNNPKLAPLLRVLSLYPFSHLILAMVVPFMVSAGRAIRAGIYTLLTESLRVTLVLSLAFADQSLMTIFWVLVIVFLVLAIVSLIDIYRLCPGRMQWFDKKLLIAQFSYMLPMMAATVVVLINKRFDKFLIGSFFEPADYAVYSCGAFELPLVGIVTASVFNALMPNMVNLWTEGRKADMIRLWAAGIRKCSLVIYPCFAILVVCAPDLIVLIFGREYSGATWPFMIYLFELPVKVAIYGSILRAAGNTRSVAGGAVVGLTTNVVVSLGLVLLGTHLYGERSQLVFLGPSIGTVVAVFFTATYLIRRISKIIEIPARQVMPWARLGRIMGLSVGAALVAYAMPVGTLPLVVRLLVRGGVFTVVLLVAALATNSLEDDEKRILAAPLRLLRRSGRRDR